MKDGKGVGGFSVELFNYVAKSLGRIANVIDMPWARCLNEVQNGRVDVAIDAYEDEERHRKFFYSTSYYTLTPQIFYRKQGGPTSMPVTNAEDLRKLVGCGVREYTYEHYDLDAKTMDLGAHNDQQMLKKVAAGRCDFGLEELEFIIGGRKETPDWPDQSTFASYTPTWARGPQLHFLVGRMHPQGAELQRAIDAGIESAKTDGFLKKLRARHFSTVPEQAAK
jgi:polar amino acid transport system substrate-binding protein